MMATALGSVKCAVMAVALAAAAPVVAVNCAYDFEAISTTAFGNLPIGTPVSVTSNFQATAAFAQEDGVLAHAIEGALSLRAGAESIEAKTRAFNVAQTSRMLDYYAMEARIVSGTLGGIDTFVDLVNLAFYGAGGSLNQNRIPKSARDFEALQGRRVLQVQSPNGDEILLARIEQVSGGCD